MQTSMSRCLNDSSDCRVLLRHAMTQCLTQWAICTVKEMVHMCSHTSSPWDDVTNYMYAMIWHKWLNAAVNVQLVAFWLPSRLNDQGWNLWRGTLGKKNLFNGNKMTKMLLSCGNILRRSFYKRIIVFLFVHSAYHCHLFVEMYIHYTCVSGTLFGLGQGKSRGETTCILQPKMLSHWLANRAPFCLCDPTHYVRFSHVPLAGKSSLSQTKALYPALHCLQLCRWQRRKRDQ